MLKQRLLWIAVGFCSALVLCGIGYVVLQQINPKGVVQGLPLRQTDLNPSDSYAYIDPLIGLKNTGTVNNPKYDSLKGQINKIISQYEQQGVLDTASVFFSDIKNPGGFTINAQEKYNPASLLKVPTMIAYYKLVETHPDILSQRLVYTGEKDMNARENIISPVHLTPGASYSIEELIERMIKYSDNNAADLLINYLNQTNTYDVFNNLFRDLGITEIDLTNDYITINAYTLFFRVLYNATYLSRTYSEKAMALLTQTDFSSGLEAGVPNNIEVAQKFGEFALQDQNGNVLKHELHNCGVVYYPDHPYMVCVMTKGGDFTSLEQVIASISHQSFVYMENTYPLAK